jgi:iron-sulfur cluster assembly protein
LGRSGGRGKPILLLTPNAVKVIADVVSTEGLPDGGGLRIAAARGDDDTFELGLSMETAPTEGDEVVELEGGRVFLEPLAAAALDDRVLDAHVHGAELHFEVKPQPPAGS